MFASLHRSRHLLRAGVGLGVLLHMLDAAAQEPSYSTATTFTGSDSAGTGALNTLPGQAIVFRDQSTRGSAPIVNNGGSTLFLGQSSAGLNSGSVTANGGGTIYFAGQATATDARLVGNGGGTITFEGDSTGGDSFITNNAVASFGERSGLGRSTITNNGTGVLTLSGQATAGTGRIDNNGALFFGDDATAAGGAIVNNGTGTIAFSGRSDAGSAELTNSGQLTFSGDSGMNAATLTVNGTGTTLFADRATAGTGEITNNGLLQFQGDSSASGAAIVGNASSVIDFAGRSTAAAASINNAGILRFGGDATAGAARIGLRPGASAVFSGGAEGGTADIQIDADATLDISGVTDGAFGLGAFRGAGAVYLGGNLLEVTTNEASVNFDGRIEDGGLSGGTSGGLLKSGSGILNLSGIGYYTGSTVVRGGTLQAGAQGAFAAASSFDVESAGTLALAGFSQTIGSLEGSGLVALEGGSLAIGLNDRSTLFAGEIDGLGALTKIGAGTLTLTGDNGYVGGTFVAEGTLDGSTRSIRGPIANAGTVILTEASAATLTGDIGALDGVSGRMVKAGAGQLTLAGRSDLDWSIQAGGVTSASDRFFGDLDIAGGANFTFDQSFDGLYAGAVTGSGAVLFSGGGIVRLAGDSASYTGVTTVGGVLSVNGALGGRLDVLSGGVLKGNGTIGSTRLADGATLAPGNSIGTINVAGDLAYAPGSIYEVEIAANGGSDRVAVSGTATLGGAAVEVTTLDPTVSYRNGQSYTILTAGTVAGRFGALSIDSAFLRSTLFYTQGEVLLGLRANDATASFASVAATPNQRATALALEPLDQTPGSASLALYNSLLFSNAPDARRAFDGLSGEIHASVTSGLLEDSEILRDAALGRLAGTFRSPAMQGAWVTGYGSSGEMSGRNGTASLDRDMGGVLVGGDTLVGDALRLGVLAGYSHGSVDLDARSSSADIDSLHAGLYGGIEIGRIGLKAGAAYSWNEVDTSRSFALGGVSDALDAESDSGTAQVFAEASYAIDLASGIRLDPFANLAYVDLESDAFQERGGAAALSGRDGSNDATVSTLGLRASGTADLGGFTLVSQGMAGWRHAYGDTSPTSRLAFATGGSFLVSGVPTDEDAAVLELGVGVAVTPASTLSVRYNGQFGSDTSENRVDLRFGMTF